MRENGLKSPELADTNLSANSASQRRKSHMKGMQVHRTKYSLHVHKINISTEFTNTINHKT